MTQAAVLREQALAALRAGEIHRAGTLFEEALRRFPTDASLLNSVGSFYAGQDAVERALGLFDRALAIDPSHLDAGLNRAIVLTRLGRATDASAFLVANASWLRRHPRYWNVLGQARLERGAPLDAVIAYDAALEHDQGDTRALHGRALAALHAGASDAVAWHERALAATPGDRHVALGLAQALEAQGEGEEARQWATALVRQLPDWPPGLELLAAQRWAAGERDSFTDHFDPALGPEVALAHAAMLAGVDRHAQAAEVAGAAARRWPGRDDLTLVELVAAGEAGDLARVDEILDRHPRERWPVERARQALRRGDPAAAAALLERVTRATPGDIAAWSLLGVAWRLDANPRHDWLSCQDGLVQQMSLELDPSAIDAVIATLNTLHDRSAMPIGQSVKDGHQTRGSLFARDEPALGVFRAAVERALDRYRAGLPHADPRHPLLRHRDDPWRIAGSWSIRLDGRGRHAAHIHPHGIVSSACYIDVPASVVEPSRPGWLEIGRPPAGLRTDLPGLTQVCPRAGHCVLFPSYLFHGTRPITAGRRLTIAFDVAP